MKQLALRSNHSALRAAASKAALAWVMAACLMAGCKSSSPSQYTAPRVEGRVLDAQTRQPLGGVTVRRVDPGANTGRREVPKGGQSMEKAPAVRTRANGAFALDSERNLALFSRSGWYSVTLSFRHADYAPFTTNYTPANAFKTSGGEPVVPAGDILLQPLSH